MGGVFVSLLSQESPDGSFLFPWAGPAAGNALCHDRLRWGFGLWSGTGKGTGTGADSGPPFGLRTVASDHGKGTLPDPPLTEGCMAAANIVPVTDADFEAVIQGPGLVVVDFWAEWCIPCKAIAPVLEDLASEYNGRLRVAKLNVDENRQTPARFGVRGIPTLLFFRDGSRVDQLIGNLPKAQVRSKIEALLA
jgi:thioredoxin